MLKELNIRNFAIIDALQVTFDGGLNIISGETGAGKSILIGALSLLLGDRASTDMIRSSEDAAVVEALFDIGRQAPLQQRLTGMGLEGGDELVIRRVISRSGKNRVYLNGTLASLGVLSSIAESLVNICGQHEHQLLLNAEHHLDILDEFAGLLPLRAAYAAVYERVQTQQGEIAAREALRLKRAEREDLLRFQMREIEEAGLVTGEDRALQEERQVLQNVQKLTEAARFSHDLLYGREGSLLQDLRLVLQHIRDIRKIDGGLKVSLEESEALYYQLEDVALTLRDYAENLTPDPGRLEAIGERLERIGRLKRKYGSSIDDILAKGEALGEELEGMAAVDEAIEEMSRALLEDRARLQELGADLSRRRQEAALRLQAAIEAEIRLLQMAGARFEVLFKGPAAGSGVPSFNPRGLDEAEFHLTTNAGEPLKPLNRIASGGELSRIILAMKQVLARTGGVGTIVFDEVDSGIGGATAEIVGEKIRDVSRHLQVLCITHLPQIACFADRHYRVTKSTAGQRTASQVSVLSDSQRLEEIARMLGGVEMTDKTKEHAREMLVRSRPGRRGTPHVP